MEKWEKSTAKVSNNDIERIPSLWIEYYKIGKLNGDDGLRKRCV